jgi:regulator of sirC expression with transglutaminase-like and TPR domain
MDKHEIQALIRLLDDPDHEVFQAIKNKLNKLGPDVIPELEVAWERNLDTLLQSRIENIIHDIHHAHIRGLLHNWVEQGATDIFTGVSLINQFQYPDIKPEDLSKKIEIIKKDIWLEINDNLTALEKIRIVNHILFEVHKYARSSSFINSAQTHFMSHLIDTHKGSPIALAVFYASIAQQLNMPVYVVALPKNFILCYVDQYHQPFDTNINENVLFYINPFNKGVVFGRKEIEIFIKQQQLENKPVYFEPCSNKETIISLVNTFIDFYQNNSEQNKAEEYKSILKILYL